MIEIQIHVDESTTVEDMRAFLVAVETFREREWFTTFGTSLEGEIFARTARRE